MRRNILLLTVALLLAACGPRGTVPAAPTAIPFPTTTPGGRIDGLLTTPVPVDQVLANPATAVALAAQPTATPNYSACPPPNPEASLTELTEGGLSVRNGIPAYLNAGGPVDGLRGNLPGEESAAIDDHDFTGEGVPEVLVTYRTPDEGGAALILTCENERYVVRYQVVLGDLAPLVLRVEDMNADGLLDVLLTSETCSEVDSLCEYRTAIVTWDAAAGRFVNLLVTAPDGDTPPSAGDVDNDRVIEVITVQAGRGSTESGPVRTGSQIYDWNGVGYVLSVSQPDPIRYVIEMVHEADRAFREERSDDAARLYDNALTNDELAYWFGGEERAILDAYARYRLLLTFAFAENGDPLTIYEALRTDYPDLETAPVYMTLADTFWRTYQTTNNLNIACAAVLEVVETRPESLSALNRYGTRNPTYTANSLCPF